MRLNSLLLLSSLVTLLSTQLVVARPTSPIIHSHGGRIHEHPLPYQGLAHRHGYSELGAVVSIKSSIEDVEGNSQKQEVIFSTVNKPRTVASKPEATLRLNKGDISCHYGEIDCNVCAVNVRQQFDRAANGGLRWRKQHWNFNWNIQYPPNNVRPLDIFDGDPAYALGIPDKHIQGFIRTNSNVYPFAGSHSHKRKGGVFIVAANNTASQSGNELSYLYKTQGRHPSALHIYGQFLVYGDNKSLVFLNINSLEQHSRLNIKLPKAAFGGGLGLARLSTNNALLVTTTPGGQKPGDRYHRFYQIETNQGKPVKINYINQSLSTVPRNWSKSYQYSESLSLITECGTGDIYAIHTTGNQNGISMLRGLGYWRLSKLNINNGKLKLDAISGFSSSQNMTSCNMRAAATVFVNQNNKLEFYCHAYAKDPDGTMFNVLGASSRNADKFYFKVGTLY